MPAVTRFGVSINTQLLEDFDRLISKKGYVNRSEAIRDLIRNHLVESKWEEGDEITVGTITIVYSHQVPDLTEVLTNLQHQFHRAIISTLHVHLDQHNCLEVLVVKGKSGDIRQIADRLIGTRGVKHGKLTMTTTGEDLA